MNSTSKVWIPMQSGERCLDSPLLSLREISSWFYMVETCFRDINRKRFYLSSYCITFLVWVRTIALTWEVWASVAITLVPQYGNRQLESRSHFRVISCFKCLLTPYDRVVFVMCQLSKNWNLLLKSKLDLVASWNIEHCKDGLVGSLHATHSLLIGLQILHPLSNWSILVAPIIRFTLPDAKLL